MCSYIQFTFYLEISVIIARIFVDQHQTNAMNAFACINVSGWDAFR